MSGIPEVQHRAAVVEVHRRASMLDLSRSRMWGASVSDLRNGPSRALQWL